MLQDEEVSLYLQDKKTVNIMILRMYAVQLPGSGKVVASTQRNFDTDKMVLPLIGSVNGNAGQSQFEYQGLALNTGPVRVKHTLAQINTAIATGSAYALVAP